MARLARLELWTALECAGGTRVAVLPGVGRCVATWRHQDIGTLAVTLPGASATAASERRVLRTVLATGSYDEWIITNRTDRHGPQGVVVTLEASDPALTLATACVVTRTEADGAVRPDFELLGLTPTQHLAVIGQSITEAGAGWMTAGTIESTARVDLTYAWSSPLEQVRRLADQTGTEWRVRRDGTSGYRIDLLTRVGSATTTIEVRLGRNLQGVTRTRSVTEQVTRVFPRGVDLGDGVRATMARNRWRISAASGTTITLADPAGGAGPILVDDQLNNRFVRVPGATPTQILDSTAATQQVVVASATGLTVDTLVEVCLSVGGADLLWLDDPIAIAAYGPVVGVADRPDATGTVNLIPNPFTRTTA